MTDQTIADMSNVNYQGTAGVADAERAVVPPSRFGSVAESSPVREIIDVAMVGLIGGGPRLAMRAAKVLLEDSYTSRASAREGRLRIRVRRRGG
jgi:hypothetical protein